MPFEQHSAMSDSSMTPDRARKNEVLVLFGMVLVIAVPALIMLAQIRTARLPVVVPADPALNPSPYGYTWSLLLFVVPTIVLGWWLSSVHSGTVAKKAFWITLAVLIPAWCLLDIFFGLTFFKFPNLGASIGTFWGYSFTNGWQRVIPIEEIGFYAFGFATMLLIYIWGDEYFLAAYQQDRSLSSDATRKLVSFHPASAIVGIVLFAGGWAYKVFGTHPNQGGFPGYFLFLVLGSIIPSVLFFRIAGPFINWRSLALTGFFMAFLSIFWEAGVGVPYQWWDYNHDQMLGVFVGPFTSLPIEAVFLWVACAWCAIISYETIQAVLRMDRRDLRAVFSMSGHSTP
jgi:hypothetical protein